MNRVMQTNRLTQDRPKSLQEIEALEILKSEIQDWANHDKDEYFLLRFLRARNLNVKKAKEMLQKYWEVRKTNKHFQGIFLKSYIPPEFVFNQIIPFEISLDAQGRIVIITKAGDAPVKEIFESVGKDELIRLALYYIEFLILISERQRKQYGCTKVVAVVDLGGLPMGNIIFPNSVSTAAYCARIYEACYPELLQLLMIINANWVCSYGYKLMKPFLSDATREKIQIYGRDPQIWKPILKKYLPENVIPAEYGGIGPALRYATKDDFQGFQAQY